MSLCGNPVNHFVSLSLPREIAHGASLSLVAICKRDSLGHITLGISGVRCDPLATPRGPLATPGSAPVEGAGRAPRRGATQQDAAVSPWVLDASQEGRSRICSGDPTLLGSNVKQCGKVLRPPHKMFLSLGVRSRVGLDAPWNRPCFLYAVGMPPNYLMDCVVLS